MKPRLWFLAVLLSLSCAHRPPANPALGELIELEISKPPFSNALWGIRVEDASGHLLYDRNGSILMMPGSNRKIFVAALAAECLGLASTLSTELWIDGPVEGATLIGDVVIKGGADPSLGGRYENDRDVRLLPFVAALRARGIGRISGSVLSDVSLFSRETIPGSWKTDNMGATYAAPVDALAFNENVVGIHARGSCHRSSAQADPHFVPVTSQVACSDEEALSAVSLPANQVAITGSARRNGFDYRTLIAIQEPGLYAAQALTEMLERHGIEVDGSPTVVDKPRSRGERVAAIESPPVYELLATVLQPSQNLYAEMLLRAAAGGPPPIDYATALRRERDFLTHEVGLDPAQFGFEDGSGLSVENMVTPAAIVRTYRYLWQPSRRAVFFDLLAAPGSSGTLSRRLAGLEGRMRGKTGTIDTVAALSGYVLMSDGAPRFFAVIVNHHLSTAGAAQGVIDRIVQAIAAH